MKPAAFLRSPRLVFRLPEVDDAPRLVGWLNDPEVRDNLDHRVLPQGLAAERRWIEDLGRRIEAKTDVVLLVLRSSDGEPVGGAGLHGINWLARFAELGLMLGREHWGQGYGGEVTERMLEYAFDELNLHAVRVRVNASHDRAIACYEKAGFEREGELRDAAWRRGRHENVVVMSVLRADWRERRGGGPG